MITDKVATLGIKAIMAITGLLQGYYRATKARLQGPRLQSWVVTRSNKAIRGTWAMQFSFWLILSKKKVFLLDFLQYHSSFCF